MKKSLSCTLLGFLLFLQPDPAHADVLAEWTFDTGTTSAERRAASGVTSGGTVSTLNFNSSFTDFGAGVVPNDDNDGIGFGGNRGDQAIFLSRANYFDNSLVPAPRPTAESYTSWGPGSQAGTGSDLSADGNAPIAFTVTAGAVSTITLESLTVDFTFGNPTIFQFQEAGASPGTPVTIPAGTVQNTKFTIPLAAPVVIAPGQTKTFTINLNSGALNTIHVIDGITLNGTVDSGSDPYQDWASLNGLSAGVDDGFADNPDADAFPNGLEWILGGNSPLGFDGTGMGTIGELLNAEVNGSGNLVFTFKRIDASEGLATLKVQFSNDLFVSDNHEVAIGATGAQGSPPDGVTVQVVENLAAADDVTVTIPASYAAPNGRLFGRLQATQP